jgi:hypothetical protein
MQNMPLCMQNTPNATGGNFTATGPKGFRNALCAPAKSLKIKCAKQKKRDENDFAKLTDQEVAAAEAIVQEAFAGFEGG